MGPRGVFRHDVCGRVQRIVHGIATMRATRVPSRSKSRRADTPSVGPAGCQKVVKSGARVGTPTGERVPRKRQDGPLLRGEFAHFVLACRGTLALRPEGIPTQRLRNVHFQHMDARMPRAWIGAVGFLFERLVGTQASK